MCRSCAPTPSRAPPRPGAPRALSLHGAPPPALDLPSSAQGRSQASSWLSPAQTRQAKEHPHPSRGSIFPGLESLTPPPPLPATSRHFHEIVTISAAGNFPLSPLAAVAKPDVFPLRCTAFKIQIPGPPTLGILQFYKALPKESDVQSFGGTSGLWHPQSHGKILYFLSLWVFVYLSTISFWIFPMSLSHLAFGSPGRMSLSVMS